MHGVRTETPVHSVLQTGPSHTQEQGLKNTVTIANTVSYVYMLTDPAFTPTQVYTLPDAATHWHIPTH